MLLVELHELVTGERENIGPRTTFRLSRNVLRSDDEKLSFHNFDRLMGVATSWRWIAGGTRSQILYLRRASDIAPRLQPIARGKVSRYRR
jgi:hypothetical protein